jgi:hypothetical protein
MRVTIPVRYKVRGVKFRHRDESEVTMLENLVVDVREVSPDELDVAMIIRSPDGGVLETVYGHGGKTWVRNDRLDDGPAMLPQHRSLAGLKLYHRQDATRREKEEAEANATRMLGDVGLLAMATGHLTPRDYSEICYRDNDGMNFIERTPETERMRGVSESGRDSMMARAVRTAGDDTIAIEGILYRRVAEPILVVGGSSNNGNTTWQFGMPDLFGREAFVRTTYPVSMRDADRMSEWFGERASPARSGFAVEVVDERYFVTRCDRLALLADANRIIERRVDRSTSTEYVMRWCALRDLYDALWKSDGEAIAVSKVLRKPEAEFDRLCELCEGVAELSGPNFVGEAIGMWNSRSIEVPTPAAAMGMTSGF